jgi:deazaflavin-dependent oxidoreductase (nitroreductase family)
VQEKRRISHGQKRTTSLGYFENDGDFVFIGSNAGFDTHPAWFHNLRGNPRATIQINDKQFQVNAEVAGLEKRDQLWVRLIDLAPGCATCAKKTRRQIPMVILHPLEA